MSMMQRNQGADRRAPIDILPPLSAPSIADEAHHRIANSLQLLCATLSLEARDVADDAIQAALTRTQYRIAAIAGVHRQLYRQSAADDVDLGDYLDELGHNLAMTCPAGRRIRVQSDAILVSCQDATAVGMIVAELVTNACKYAYPTGVAGDVAIGLRRVRDGYRVTVADQGRGLQGGATGEGLGHRLIATLAGQLHASYGWSAGLPGTCFDMICPLR